MEMIFLTDQDEKRFVKTVNKTAPDENGNVTVEGGGASVQADLNQSDPTAPDYVKGRTHWAEQGMVEVLAECQPTYDEGEACFPITSGVPALVVGETYIVNWNGVEYSATAFDGSGLIEGSIALGDIYTMSGGNLGTEATGEPFVICSVPAAPMGLVFPLDGSTELTLSIYQGGETVHKLDPKFLPEGVPYVEMGEVEIPVSVIEDNGDYGITARVGLVVGETYTVKWHDRKYEVTGLDVNALSGGKYPGVGIGNTAALGGPDNGVPFGIADFGMDAGGGLYGLVVPVHSTYDENFAIYQGGETIHKLDNKFLDLAWLPTMEESVILAKQTVTADGIRQDPLGSGVLVYPASIKGTIDLNETTEVVVEVDGTKYDAYYIVGNGVNFISATADAVTMIGGKFYVYWAEGNGVFCHVTEGNHTFAAYVPTPSKMPADFLPNCVVKTVNGTTPDENGNVTITIPEQTQPDWLAKEGESGYILNNPLREVEGLTEIIAPMNMELQGDFFVEPTDAFSQFTAGETYRVVFNGTAKDCVAVLNSGDGVDTNIQLGNDDPFTINIFELGEISAYYPGVTELTLAIYSIGKTMKIDPTYLPEVTLTSPNGTKYALTVSDDGTLSASAVTE